MSMTTVVLSVILAILSLEKPILLLYYFVSTFFATVAVFAIRIRISGIKMSQQEEDLPETEKSGHGLKQLLPMIIALIAFLAIPLALARVLNPYVWFIFFVSLMTGFSLAEIAFYIYTRK